MRSIRSATLLKLQQFQFSLDRILIVRPTLRLAYRDCERKLESWLRRNQRVNGTGVPPQSLVDDVIRIGRCISCGRNLTNTESRVVDGLNRHYGIPEEDLLLIWGTGAVRIQAQQIKIDGPRWFTSVLTWLIKIYIAAQIIQICLLSAMLSADPYYQQAAIILASLSPLILIGYLFDAYFTRPMLIADDWLNQIRALARRDNF